MKPLKTANIYDKRRPEGKQTVAHISAVAGEDHEPTILFACQQYTNGVMFLSKQHAVEFASCMLMLALGLPGDIPEGDCGISDKEEEVEP